MPWAYSWPSACRKSARRLSAGEQRLLDDGVDAPVAVDDLRDTKVDGDGHERDGLVLAEPARGHEEVAHLAEGVTHRQIHRGLRVDFALRLGAELGEVFRVAETVQHPLVLGFEQWVLQAVQRGAGERVALA